MYITISLYIHVTLLPGGWFFEYKSDYRSVQLSQIGSSSSTDTGNVGPQQDTFRGILPSGKERGARHFVATTPENWEWLDKDDEDFADEDFYGSMAIRDSTKDMMRRMRFSLEDSNTPAPQ